VGIGQLSEMSFICLLDFPVLRMVVAQLIAIDRNYVSTGKVLLACLQ
jgi:hypothetical protein